MLMVYISNIPTLEEVVVSSKRFIGSFMTSIAYVDADTKRNKRGLMVGITTVFLVCFYTVMLQTMVSRSSLLFVKLAENNVGEFDLLLTPTASTSDQVLNNIDQRVGSGDESTTKSFTVNFTEIQERLNGIPTFVKGSAPRWVGYARALGLSHPPATYTYTTITQNNTVVNVTATDTGVMSVVMSFDTLLEKAVGIAPSWNHRPLGFGECHVSSSLLRALNVRPRMGEAIRISVNTTLLLTTFGLTTGLLPDPTVGTTPVALNLTQAQLTQLRTLLLTLQTITNNTQPIIDTLLNTTVDFVNQTAYITPPPALASLVLQNLTFLSVDLNVIDPIGQPKGKWPSALGNVILLEKKHLIATLLSSVETLVNNYQFALSLLTSAGLDPSVFALPPSFDPSLLRLINIDDFAMFTIVRVTDRMNVFQKSRQNIYHDMAVVTNAISNQLGVTYPAVFEIPLAEAVGSTYIFRLFLDQIFNASLVILIVLGSLLIYCLMLADVEEKTFEYGMLRALGMRSSVLAQVIVSQAMYFAVPGIALGITVGYLGYLPLSDFIATYSYSPVLATISTASIITAVSLGLVVPLFSNLLPIRKALSSKLRDSLDRYHQTSHQVSVTATRLEDFNISPVWATIGVLLVVIGFMIYYLMPASFIFQNLALFLGLLTSILVSMIIGLILVSQSLQPYLEARLLPLILWGEDKKLSTLISKNMSGHSRRNQKTALMYTIALAFALFASSMSTLQSQSIIDSIRSFSGSDILIQSFGWGKPLNYVAIKAFLTNQLADSNSGLQDFAFVTLPLFYYDAIDEVYLSTLSDAGLPIPITLYGLEQNYLSATFNEFVNAPLYDKDIHYSTTSSGSLDFVQSLYTTPANKSKCTFRDRAIRDGLAASPVAATVGEGCIINRNVYASATLSLNETTASSMSIQSQRSLGWAPHIPTNETCTQTIEILISYAVQSVTSIQMHQPSAIQIALLRPSGLTLSYTFLPRAMLSKLPGFFLSSYSITSWLSGAFVTMDTYSRLLRDLDMFSIEIAPGRSDYRFHPRTVEEAMGRCAVMMKPGATDKQRERIMNGLRVFIDDDAVVLIDTAQTTKYASVATSMLLLYFTIVSGVGLIMCFFVLWLSFTANMRDNSWELGVLRALGLTFNRVLRAYIYEGCCVIVTAMLMGTTIGLLTSLTLTLQFNLFTEMKLNFQFPSLVFALVVVMTFFSLIAGTSAPGYQFEKKPIANLLKGL